jgi:hypothetical protein
VSGSLRAVARAERADRVHQILDLGRRVRDCARGFQHRSSLLVVRDERPERPDHAGDVVDSSPL